MRHSPAVYGSSRPCRLHLQVLCRQKLRSRLADIDGSQPLPRISYEQLLTRRRREPDSCPALFLAPMENLADRPLRMAMASCIWGFDEACTEFIRVPGKIQDARHLHAVVRGITAGYDARELGVLPLGAQIMGSDPELLAATAVHLANELGAPRIDLNCGCPANKVTGHGAGSTLLKTPERLEAIVRSLVDAVAGSVPVSVKMRSGFNDTTLMEDNLTAAQAGGAAFVTLHARTKAQGYNGRADWGLIRRARQLLRIPVIGNGDVVSVAAARQLLEETNCDGIMIGRGAVTDPFIFHRIRASFARQQHQHQQPGGSNPWHQPEAAAVEALMRAYAEGGFEHGGAGGEAMTHRGRCGRLKKIMRYLFAGSPQLQAAAAPLLSDTQLGPEELLEAICAQLRAHWHAGGPEVEALVNHMGQGSSTSMAARPAHIEAELAVAAATC